MLTKKQIEQIEKHVDHKDYCGTLATRISIALQCPAIICNEELFTKNFTQIIEELEFIQDNYEIFKTKIPF